METHDTSTHDRPAPHLARPVEGRLLGGVAAGIAQHLDLDVTVVRIALIILGLFGGMGIPLYAAAWLLIPDEDTGVALADDLRYRTHLR